MTLAGAGSDGAVIRVSLEVDLDTEPIAGTVEVAGRSPISFVGWIRLASFLEDLRTRSDLAAATQEEAHP